MLRPARAVPIRRRPAGAGTTAVVVVIEKDTVLRPLIGLLAKLSWPSVGSKPGPLIVPSAVNPIELLLPVMLVNSIAEKEKPATDQMIPGDVKSMSNRFTCEKTGMLEKSLVEKTAKPGSFRSTLPVGVKDDVSRFTEPAMSSWLAMEIVTALAEDGTSRATAIISF